MNDWDDIAKDDDGPPTARDQTITGVKSPKGDRKKKVKIKDE